MIQSKDHNYIQSKRKKKKKEKKRSLNVSIKKSRK